MRCHFIVRTGFLKAFIMFPLNHQQLLKTSARNDSARFLEAFPVSIPSPTFIRIKNFFRCSSANIHGTNIKGGISGPYKLLALIIEDWWRCTQTYCRSGSAVRASRSPEPSAFLSPDFLGPEKPRKRSRSLFGGLFGKKEVCIHHQITICGIFLHGSGTWKFHSGSCFCCFA